MILDLLMGVQENIFQHLKSTVRRRNSICRRPYQSECYRFFSSFSATGIASIKLAVDTFSFTAFESTFVVSDDHDSTKAVNSIEDSKPLDYEWHWQCRWSAKKSVVHMMY
jgi:hypothetical protein